MARRYFPDDIRAAILEVCHTAPPPLYGANLVHTDTGEPTASLGRLSGGHYAIGVSDDFIVGPLDDRWAVWSNRGVLLGSYVTAGELRAGLSRVVQMLYAKQRPGGARRREQRALLAAMSGPLGFLSALDADDGAFHHRSLLGSPRL